MQIENYTKQLIKQAIDYGASDIHVLPRNNEYVIYFRLSSSLIPTEFISFERGKRIISYLKYLANMDVGDFRRPQGGALEYKLSEEDVQDIRLSTITNYCGQESLVIRLLEVQKKISLEKSTFFVENINNIKKLTNYKSGLILFSGPVNSGKTTTMYELIRNRLKREDLQVITIEDPVEITENDFFQVQVNKQAGNSYESALKASLRHHPDILLVGEIRDEETAKMAIRGALTGHLILASVHAKDAEGVLMRLNELGISFELLHQTLLAVVFQKLLPKYCALCDGNCKMHCSHYAVNEKRCALYDVLNRDDLNQIADKNYNLLKIKRCKNFNYLLKKVLVYGFISEETYRQNYIP